MSFFSIIIPIYGTEKFLERCLDSVLNQSFNDYEIICVNDCSPGNCDEIIKKYKTSKITYIKNSENSGTHISRMNGVMNSNSVYTLFLDSDDYYKLDTLSILYEKLLQTNVDQLEFGYETFPKRTKSVFQYISNKDSILEKVLRGEKDYTNFSLCNKVTKTILIKEAFSKMKQFYCVWFEDGYEQFYISSLCKTFDSLERYLLVLDETSGITVNKRTLTAEKYLLRCSNVYTVLMTLSEYIEQVGLTKYKAVIENSWKVHPAYLIDFFLPTVEKKDFVKAIQGMGNYFPEQVINERLYHLFHKNEIPLKKKILNKIKRIVIK